MLVAGADTVQATIGTAVETPVGQSYELVFVDTTDNLVEAVETDVPAAIILGDGLEADPETVIERLPVARGLPLLYVGTDSPSDLLDAGVSDFVSADEPATVVAHRLDTAIATFQYRQPGQQDNYRDQIERLHDVGVGLAGADSATEVYDLMVEAAEDILDLDMCIVDSVQDGRLTIEATSSEITEYDEPPVDSQAAGIAGIAYRDQESVLIKDTENFPEAKPAGEYRSGMTVPIGEFGVFQAVSADLAAFDQTDLEVVEILCEHVKEALRRIEQERQLHEQREQLIRENERLEEFASIVSHDLRNPLNVAQLRFDLVKSECDSDHLDSVEQSLERMETLIEDVLTLARGGNTVSDFEELSLLAVARAAWRNVDTQDATLSIEDDVEIHADESRLQQLFENLFRNAVEHAIPDGADTADLTVEVGVFEEGFYVADNGVGIPAEVRDELFTHDGATTEDGGGLGLAIVSRIAEAHGWDVQATDATTGGARFELIDVDFVAD